MRNSTILGRTAAGCLLAALITFSFGDGTADAARRGKVRRGGVLAIRSIDVASSSGVALNHVIRLTFNKPVDASTVRPAVVQIRAQNATRTGYTKQVFGEFQVSGRVVRFFPRLPTHLRDSDGSFFPMGSAADDAAENGGFQPGTEYEIRVLGRPNVSPVRSTSGRPLRRTRVTRFKTEASFTPTELFETEGYADAPPPQIAFSNPPDRVAAVGDQYTLVGGTKGVPNAVGVSLFCTKVPLAVTTARILGNVSFTLIARKGDPTSRRPVAGTVYVEQNFETTLLNLQPDFPLADLGVYALRISKQVKDLTEQYDFAPNRDRAHARALYDDLTALRAQQGGPPELLPDPSAELLTDWPELGTDPDAVAKRGVLKANLLDLCDNHPDEVDPRVMVLFSTRDEPVSDAFLRVEFNKAEDLFDGKISTAEVDESVPGAASGIFTIAGGAATDGDFFPSMNTTISIDDYAADDYTVNWRKVLIPDGVRVNLTGSRPVTLKAFQIEINGEIHVDGSDGGDGNGSGSNNTYFNYKPKESDRPLAGIGGPGGGDGGRPSLTLPGQYPNAKVIYGGTGEPGNDIALVPAAPDVGGQGGLGGGTAPSSSAYSLGGGGGGGGGQFDGGKGADATYPTSSYGWNGKGGAGGKGSLNESLNPLVGGAGGGGGGNGAYLYPSTSYQNWHKFGGSGGGGGGALLIQTSGSLTVGPNALISARGGEGGAGTGSYSTLSGGPGGGGGGGSILLRSTDEFQIADPSTALDATGGPGGKDPAGQKNYTAPYGGDGGDGYVRLEDPMGGMQVPGGTMGEFDPVGAGVASYVYTKFADLGVQDPRILEFTNEDVVTDPTSNDAILVEIQMTRESLQAYGEADLTAIDQSSQDTTDETITSNWIPLKVHDRTGIAGGVFSISGYDPGVQGLEHVFGVADQLNDRGYRFVRYRITFQNDATQSRMDPLPNVDAIQLNFQFNF